MKTPRPSPRPPGPLEISRADAEMLLSGSHWNPHAVLGNHAVAGGVVIRVMHHDASAAEVLIEGRGPIAMERIAAGGIFAALVPGAALPLRYQARLHFPGGQTWTREDPYRFLPTVGEIDQHLFNEGNHRRLWECLGAHARTIDGVAGVSFAVWAPGARRVSVIGDFCHWDGRSYPMRSLGNSGVWELFVPGVAAGAVYKFEIKTQTDALRIKADPCGQWMEVPPANASRVFQSSYAWGDHGWLEQRRRVDPRREPMLIYEVHFGSWARVPEEGNRPLTYREIAPRLIEHCRRLGFNFVEFMPLAEHPFGGSWGYQVSGYYAPTARFGTPDDFRFMVDQLHQAGIGVIVDWVPAHFPKDDFALARFDGTALYEHEDPRLGEHPDWGTLIFNYGRREVRSFLISNALYWLRELHVDGLRVDAVASMIYRDYSRKAGEWIPNHFGGNENFEALDLLRSMNEAVRIEAPGCFTTAEESTAYGGVSNSVQHGGLGFTFKWNMGWMHDTLVYFSKDPVHRRFHHWQLSFAMVYEYHERFVMPLSHDEIVHGKRALLVKMPGDHWQKLANLRLLLAYQYTRPGKKLLFMGTELAPYDEWHYDHSLPWHLADDPDRQRLQHFMSTLGRLYQQHACFWRDDHDPAGFAWISFDDGDNSVLSFIRRGGGEERIVVLNFTPVPRDGYRIGVPPGAGWTVELNSDAPEFGGSGYSTAASARTEPTPWHGFGQSVLLRLPPLGALVLRPG